MMEQLTRHLSRQHPQIDIINLRLAAVPAPDKMTPPPEEACPLSAWTVGQLTHMHLDDAVRVFTLAAESPVKPGVRIMNACTKNAMTRVPVAEVLRLWWGEEVDLSWYEQPGHEFDGLFDVKRIEDELGFVAQAAL